MLILLFPLSTFKETLIFSCALENNVESFDFLTFYSISESLFSH